MKPRTLALGALAFWPAFYFVFFIVVVGMSAATSDRHGENGSGELIISEWLLFTLHIGTMVLIIALLVVFIRHAYKSPRVPDDKRTFWAVVLFMGNAIAMPIYWWVYMRDERSHSERADDLR